MLSFVNIEENLSYQDVFGIPDKDFGQQFATSTAPLDFQYPSTEAVSSFVAVLIDAFGVDFETITLSTSLINSTGSNHVCDGLTDYTTPLECGTYYFLVNGKYKSELFHVVPQLIETSSFDPEISVSGLRFVDSTLDFEWKAKFGAPVQSFGLQYSEDSRPLPFIYKATDSVSSFSAVLIDNLGNVISTTSLSTSLISSDGTYHKCDGLTNYASTLDCGTYYFVVNDRYISDVFKAISFDDISEEDALLLETGDFLLFETGDKLLLE